ncbi:MAG: DUF1668 domain-containing protein [Pirellulales bacterium]
MVRILRRHLSIVACIFASFGLNATARGHFLWLKSIEADGRPQAFLYFGENANDEAYHFPDALAGIEVWRRTADGKRTKLVTKPLDTAGRIGRVAPLPESGAGVLEASGQYGLYHGMLLTYYAKHVQTAAGRPVIDSGPSKELALDVVPRIDGDQLRLAVTWNGKPLADAAVNIAVGDAEAVEKKTDGEGMVAFKLGRNGLVSVLANFRDANAKGELKGESYTSAAHFVTLTIEWSAASARNDSERKTEAAAKPPAAVPPLPEPLASFGAAVADGWLYVYGGHKGEPHDHSAANLSKHFRRVQLTGGREWEELPMQTPLQGLAMVAHGGRLYRIGGMNARNATVDQEADLHSTDEFACYDPAARTWTALPPLPAPRSSHDAVVIGDKLYVVGGWTLDGPSRGKWIDDAVVFDCAKPQAASPLERTGWQVLPKAPFQRRALAVGEWRGKVVAIGGIDGDGAVLEDVSIFDPASGAWSAGPSLPAGEMAGFGASAWNRDGQLYVSGLPGVLYRLSDDGTKWDEAAPLKTPRFFHRLLSAGQPNILMAIAGAAEDGHVADIELVEIGRAASVGR